MYENKIKRGKRYFEGWYFRLIAPISKKSIAFIPGVSLGTDSHAFIQVLTDEGLTDYHRFSLKKFSYKKKPLTIKIGPNLFSTKFIQLKLNGKLNIEGFLKFNELKTLKFNLMGPFSLLPNLPCYHRVISMKHYTKGTLTVNNKTWHHEIGYIETDKGHSFPNGHVWLQCNTFNEKGLSISCAVSEITIGKRSIPVCYAILQTYNKKYYLTTWLGAKTTSLKYRNNNLQISIKQRGLVLDMDILLPQDYPNQKQHLLSPINGNMHSRVNEILSGDISVSLVKGNKPLINAKGNMCAAEVNNITNCMI